MRPKQKFLNGSARLLLVGLLVAVSSTSALAIEAAGLVPLTKLRLTVVQFVPATGDYKSWDALGGDLEVGPDGTVAVPTLGSIDVTDLGAAALGTEIGRRLKAKLGLLDAPDASVRILEYPPVYVVGGVAKPGQYPFRPGMTVAQALALAGGEHRTEAGDTLSDTIKLEADLNGYARDFLRTSARLARLKSEFAREKTISFPPALDPSDPSIAEILEQERRIFEAHINGFERQQTGLVHLAELYNAEIDALGQKEKAIDEQIARAQKQVDAVQSLVNAGSATISRLSDSERILADLRSDKLDNLIATMTARENLNRSERDLARLQDEQQSDASIQLQTEQAGLERLQLSQVTTMRMLRQSVEINETLKLANTVQISLSYSLVRQEQGNPTELPATDASLLMPGDLVRVTTQMDQPAGSAMAENRMITLAQP
ncbi:SLBB domain-containing protein [Devosia rhodophyticola]|uniref:SLBB domain-containing protein n=1 Tax=Devosia rhodophyticola TaxID=3026423 RepID=A0ABY7YYC9_9HYPH|nr:SLBB domain-containing protein [Devosia rhodophyticola]WDR06232.1 SLBB domain-containing protein [Devosia rhodophyticola]